MHHSLLLRGRTGQQPRGAAQGPAPLAHAHHRHRRDSLGAQSLPGEGDDAIADVDMGVPALSVNVSADDEAEDPGVARLPPRVPYAAGPSGEDAASIEWDGDGDGDDDPSSTDGERARLLSAGRDQALYASSYGSGGYGLAGYGLEARASPSDRGDPRRPGETPSRGLSRAPSPGILSQLAGGLRRVRRESTASTVASDSSRHSTLSSRSRRLSGLAALPKPIHADSRFVDTFAGLRERHKSMQQVRASVTSQTALLAHAQVRFHDYSPERLEVADVQDVTVASLDKPEWATVRWIDIDGLDITVMEAIGLYFRLHPLALDDCFQVPQQPKIDFYLKDDIVEHNHLFMITNMMFRDVEGVLCTEQVSIFMLDGILITVQEGLPGDVWSKVRSKLSNPLNKIRCYDVSYLLYALLDGIVAACYPEVESLGASIDDIELDLLSAKRLKINVTTLVYQLKRDLLLVRRTMGPMRDVVVQMMANDEHFISKTALAHLADVKDSAGHLVELMETYWECSTQLSFLYSDRQAHKMNAVLYRLTLLSSVFLPLTFVAGVYGMNFDEMPELRWKYGYLYSWMVFLGLAGIALATFMRMGLMDVQPA